MNKAIHYKPKPNKPHTKQATDRPNKTDQTSQTKAKQAKPKPNQTQTSS